MVRISPLANCYDTLRTRNKKFQLFQRLQGGVFLNFILSARKKKSPWELMFSRAFVVVRLKVVLDHDCRNRDGRR